MYRNDFSKHQITVRSMKEKSYPAQNVKSAEIETP